MKKLNKQLAFMLAGMMAFSALPTNVLANGTTVSYAIQNRVEASDLTVLIGVLNGLDAT